MFGQSFGRMVCVWPATILDTWFRALFWPPLLRPEFSPRICWTHGPMHLGYMLCAFRPRATAIRCRSGAIWLGTNIVDHAIIAIIHRHVALTIVSHHVAHVSISGSLSIMANRPIQSRKGAVRIMLMLIGYFSESIACCRGAGKPAAPCNNVRLFV